MRLHRCAEVGEAGMIAEFAGAELDFKRRLNTLKKSLYVAIHNVAYSHGTAT